MAAPNVLLTGAGMTGRTGRLYVASEELLAAANVAITCGVPLLLTGESGSGKTEFAFAVESELSRLFGRPSELLTCYVRSDTRAADLLYRYDALRRFADAQHGDPELRSLARDARNYVELGPLGVGIMSPFRRVVLIDEIDKASRDVPNDLLIVLEDGRFEIEELGSLPMPGSVLERIMVAPNRIVRPMVIVTSNEERRLPDAFLRRCAYYHVPEPEGEHLQAILRAHFPDASQRLRDLAGGVLHTLRQPAVGLEKRPGVAEILTWLQAVSWPAAKVELVIDELLCEPAMAELYATLGQLPALSCLVKTREDLARVRRFCDEPLDLIDED